MWSFWDSPSVLRDASLIPIHYSPRSRRASSTNSLLSLLRRPLHILQALSFVYDEVARAWWWIFWLGRS